MITQQQLLPRKQFEGGGGSAHEDEDAVYYATIEEGRNRYISETTIAPSRRLKDLAVGAAVVGAALVEIYHPAVELVDNAYSWIAVAYGGLVSLISLSQLPRSIRDSGDRHLGQKV